MGPTESNHHSETWQFVRFFLRSKGPPQVLFSVLLATLSLGAIFGVVPAVASDRYARIHHDYTGETQCYEFALSDRPKECQKGYDDAQNAAAVSSFARDLLTFLTSSLVGSLSDTRGRRGVFLLGLCFQVLVPLSLVVLQLVDNMNPAWYYSSDSISGMVKWLAIAFACMSDVMPPTFRAPSYGLLICTFYIGFALGPVVAIHLDHLRISIFALVCSVGSVAFTVLGVTETLPEGAASTAMAHHSREGWDNDQVLAIQKVLRPLQELAILSRGSFFRLISIVAFINGTLFSADKTLAVYFFEDHLDFNQRDVAVFFGILGSFGILTQAIIYKALLNYLREKHVVIASLSAGGIENFLFGSAKTKLIMYIAAGFGGSSDLVFVTISSMAANNVGEHEQGHISGALFSLTSVANALGPVLLQLIYNATEATSFPGPGTMFFVAAILYFIGVAVASAIPASKANSKNREQVTALHEDSDQTEHVAPLLDTSEELDEA